MLYQTDQDIRDENDQYILDHRMFGPVPDRPELDPFYKVPDNLLFTVMIFIGIQDVPGIIIDG